MNRVNLIGEHIDYCGYAVCPMALEQDVFLAVAAKDGYELELCNLDSNYCDYCCSIQDISWVLLHIRKYALISFCQSIIDLDSVFVTLKLLDIWRY